MFFGYALEIGKFFEFVFVFVEDVDWMSEKECFEICV